MILEATSYPNRFRTISGLINFVFSDDSIILCDTTSGAVSLELAEIPANYWNTIYKLYVKDASGNASVNNITITAPVGFTINGQSSIVINQDDGDVIVRITSNTTYVGQFGYATATGLAVLDQNILLTPNCASMNFVGSNITATNVGNAVTVSVTNNFVILSFAQLTNLINTNTVVPNQAYLITDAIFGSTPPINTNIVVNGVTTNRVALQGEGIFYNADYQLVGNYSGITGFGANLGLWSSALLPSVNDVVIWNNFHYLNLTGINTANNPSADLVNWQQLTYSQTNGYILEVDEITYDQFSNQIMKRTDKRNNIVERGVVGGFNSFNGFAWGNNKVFDNKVLGNSSVRVMNCNVEDEFSQNEFYNSYFLIGDTNIQGNCSFFKSNNIKDTTAHIVNKASSFQNNVLFTTTLDIQNNEGSLLNNQFYYSQITLSNNLGLFIFNNLDHSNLEITTQTVGSSFSNNLLKETTMFVVNNEKNIIDNVINYCNVTFGTNQNIINENKLLNSTIVFTTNSATGEISKNTFEFSTITITTNNGNITEVVKSGGNHFCDSILTIRTNNSDISGNYFTNSSSVILGNVNAAFYNNTGNNTSISIQTLNSSFALTDTRIAIFNEITLNQNISTGNYYPNNLATIEYELDMSDPTIYDPATFTLTIPSSVNRFCGIYTLINGAGLNINKIVNGDSNIETTFKNNAAIGTITFNSVLYGGAAAGDIVSSNGAFAYNIALTDRIILSLQVINKVLSSNIIV
jgi:hypothetical protein